MGFVFSSAAFLAVVITGVGVGTLGKHGKHGHKHDDKRDIPHLLPELDMFGRAMGDHHFTMGHLFAIAGMEAMHADIAAKSRGGYPAWIPDPNAGARHQLLQNQTFARLGFEENEEAKLLYTYLTGDDVSLPRSDGTEQPWYPRSPAKPTPTTLRRASRAEATSSPEEHSTNLNALVSLVPLSAHAIVSHKPHYDGSEPIYSLFLSQAATPDDIGLTLESWQKKLAHHATTLVPGMMERVGAEAFAKQVGAWAVKEWYKAGEAKSGNERREVGPLESWTTALKDFKLKMEDWEKTLV